MTRHTFRSLVLATTLLGICLTAGSASAVEGLWKREISYQAKGDLFAQYYEGPNPSGATAGMYVSPVPTPPNVGYTYTTYQPLMPHEYLYAHKRTHYAYTPGAGWTRAKVRYGTAGLRLDNLWYDMTHCCH
ncbi:MAG: hypothetical protein KDA44_16830 [Planctomycetales bacterium]|nr:hypothetical protein [Planctomycetales bacterium]